MSIGKHAILYDFAGLFFVTDTSNEAQLQFSIIQQATPTRSNRVLSFGISHFGISLLNRLR